MSNSESRWGAVRAFATAIMVVLCSVLADSTAHADGEIFRETLQPSPSTEQTILTDKQSADEKARKQQELANKQKRQDEASSSGAQISVVPVPIPLPPMPPTIVAPSDAPAPPGLTEPAKPQTLPGVHEPAITPVPPVLTEPAKPPALPGLAEPADSSGANGTSGSATDQTDGSSPTTPTIKPSEAPPIEPDSSPDPAAADPSQATEVETAVEDEPWTAERTIALLTERALAHGSAVYEVLAVARCETGYTFLPWRANGYLLRGSLGEVGVGQWLPPVERNHWGRTPHWREHRYHILAGYVQGDPSAIWWDADALAWSMGPAAPAGFRSGWSCWRIRGPWWFV